MEIKAPIFGSSSSDPDARFITELLDDAEMGDNKAEGDDGEGDSDGEGRNNSNSGDRWNRQKTFCRSIVLIQSFHFFLLYFT